MSDTIWLSSLQQKIHQSFFKLCSIITTFVTNTKIHTTYGCLNQHHSQVSLCTFDYIHIFQKYFMVVLLYLDVLILHLKCKKFIFCAFSMLLLLKAHNKNFWGAKSGLVCQRPTVKFLFHIIWKKITLFDTTKSWIVRKYTTNGHFSAKI